VKIRVRGRRELGPVKGIPTAPRPIFRERIPIEAIEPIGPEVSSLKIYYLV
jgi:hypothetical protein